MSLFALYFSLSRTLYLMSEIIDIARSVFKIEIEELAKLEAKIDHHFSEAVKCIHSSKGRVIVTRMGKSGIIGQKFSPPYQVLEPKAFYSPC